MLRQIIVAAAFFLSSIILMRSVRGSEYTLLIEAQNEAYIIVAAAAGGLQPSLMYFTIRNEKNIRTILKYAFATICISVVVIAAFLAYIEGYRPLFWPHLLISISILVSSTLPFLLLASDKVALFSSFELIPNIIFLVFSFFCDGHTTASSMILFFSIGHIIKAIICLFTILAIAKSQVSIDINVRSYVYYLITSGFIGLGHSIIQRMPALIISQLLSFDLKAPVLSGWVLLDRSQTIQQSVNLWLFKKNTTKALNPRSIMKLMMFTSVFGLLLALTLYLAIEIIETYGIRSEYKGTGLAILAMSPCFIFAIVRSSLQTISISNGRNRMVLFNVYITLIVLYIPLMVHISGPIFIAIWITASFFGSSLMYIFYHLISHRSGGLSMDTTRL
jgi:F0F1-type ATP synthase assembly protein I